MPDEGISLFREFFKVIKEINERKLKYAVIGGIAMAFHDEPRFTRDIDILLHPDDLDVFNEVIKKAGYFKSTKAWTLKETNLTIHRFLKIDGDDQIMIDVLVANAEEHQKIIENVVYEESNAGSIRLANKEDMIMLKKSRYSDQDQVDIKRLKDDKN